MPKKLTIEYVKAAIESFNGHKLLSEVYVGCASKLEIMPPCGHLFWMSWKHFNEGHRCPECAHIKSNLAKTLNFEYVKAAIESFDGYKLLSEVYVGCASKLEIMSPCGHVFWMSWDNFKQGERCPKCAGNLKLLIEDIKAAIESFDGHKLLSEVYVGCASKLEIMSPCGHVFWMSWDNFKQGGRCPECALKNNRGENHYNWNPNKTDEEREQGRNYPEKKKWVKAILKRDDHTCQSCNIRGGTLNAHHIAGWSTHKSERFNVDNGVTLCQPCHDSYHYDFNPSVIDHDSFYHWMVLYSVIKPENWLWTVQYPKSMNGWLKAFKRVS